MNFPFKMNSFMSLFVKRNAAPADYKHWSTRVARHTSPVLQPSLLGPIVYVTKFDFARIRIRSYKFICSCAHPLADRLLFVWVEFAKTEHIVKEHPGCLSVLVNWWCWQSGSWRFRKLLLLCPVYSAPKWNSYFSWQPPMERNIFEHTFGMCMHDFYCPFHFWPITSPKTRINSCFFLLVFDCATIILALKRMRSFLFPKFEHTWIAFGRARKFNCKSFGNCYAICTSR